MPEPLKTVWIECVKKRTGVERYFVSRRFNSVIARAEKIIRNLDADPEEFCMAQLDWAVKNNYTIYPTLLVGDSVSRWESRETRQDKLASILNRFKSQVHQFSTAARNVNHRHAVYSGRDDYDPLFFLYVAEKHAKDLVDDRLLREARKQLELEPEWAELYPENVLGLLTGQGVSVE